MRTMDSMTNPIERDAKELGISSVWIWITKAKELEMSGGNIAVNWILSKDYTKRIYSIAVLYSQSSRYILYLFPNKNIVRNVS